ncbi:M13 family metallopeptidase [Sphingosinicella rhizophila]|uniref:M13-type metalloendopeptidase n=1 Tax=Sphingosinicella rhizophila TaxID=3050082 RepID=A0ABU3Q4Y5_9SPHN|nr:M13-type metalloendopeptidase [Sphingosinicella sp. GR2756]MDT9598479.1 M13-type metalloendopeptidase [Sphingosinicella sp. GR2756]
MLPTRVTAAAVSLAILASATSGQSQTHSAADIRSEAPKIGAWGMDLEGMDRDTAPGDSFYQYASGRWDRRTEIPSDRARWGGFDILRDLSDQRVRLILEDAARASASAGTELRKIGDFYAGFMDEEAIERRGADPLQPYLGAIGKIASRTDLARALGEANQAGVAVPINLSVRQDYKDSSLYAAYLSQGGLGMPDRDYYLQDGSEKFASLRDAYVHHVAAMLRLAGLSEPEARARRIFDLETKIAKAHWSRVEQRHLDKLHNPMSRAELDLKMPGFPWPIYLAAAGAGKQGSFIVAHPSAIAGAASLLQSEPLQNWRDYLSYQTISAAGPMLSRPFVEQDFAFKGRAIQGTPELKERWKRGTDLVGTMMAEAVGRIYVRRHFPPEAKAKADELVRNLIAAMDARLARLAWMSPATKAKARAKLATFKPKIGYPDTWRDYSRLRIVAGDNLGNMMRAKRFEYQRNLDKLGKPVARDEWIMSPQTVNAYANPSLNEVVFPAAILQPPFFDPNADMAVNYGAIGAIIGHEISHHFDDQGRKFDAEGNLSEWWSPEDLSRFQALSAQVVAQYAAYEPVAGTHVNGELTLGENLADLAGLNMAYDAYKLSLNGKTDAVNDGFSGDQRFFLGFAQIWRTKYRAPALLQVLTIDPHSPNHLRVNVVRNLDSWYSAFGVTKGALYLAPENRIRIW